MSYEANFKRIFPLYQKLVEQVLKLQSQLPKLGCTLPAWTPDKQFHYHDNQVYLGTSTTEPKLVSRTYPENSPNSEFLGAVAERLVRDEIQRWYNRGHDVWNLVYTLLVHGMPVVVYFVLDRFLTVCDVRMRSVGMEVGLWCLFGFLADEAFVQ